MGKSTYLQLSGYFSCIKRLELPAPTQIAASFTIYTLFYVMAYHTVSHYPRYELDFKDIKRNLVATRELVLFLIFFGLLFLLRNARLLFDERLFDLAIYGFLLLFICVRVCFRTPEEGMEVAKLAESVYFSKWNAREFPFFI